LRVKDVGRVLSLTGVVCALIGIFILEGISIEFPGIILGALGYYFGLRAQDRLGQILAGAAIVLCVVSIGISGLEGPPQ
jgi:small-conductance mechanosensitive channel